MELTELKKLTVAFWGATALMLQTGCAPRFTQEIKPQGRNASLYDESATDMYDAGTSTGENSGSSTGVPPIVTRVGGVGYSSTTFTVQVNKVLKVKFTPGIQDEAAPQSNYVYHYSKLGIFVSIEGRTRQATEMLSNGLFDQKPETSRIIDLSTSFSRTCGGDEDCRQNVTITIDQPNNDFWCLNAYANCPWSHVPDGHPWHGTLTIQTDDTDAI